MPTTLEQLQTYARQELARIYGETEHQDLYVMFKAKEKNMFSRVSQDQFGMEYLTAKLAMACLVWEYACLESALNEDSFRKVLFRQVMDGFRSPKMMPLATAFSDYYFTCEKEPSESPGILLVMRFMGRLNLQDAGAAAPRNPDAPVPFVFQTLLETLEGFRSSFENQCLESFLNHYGKTR